VRHVGTHLIWAICCRLVRNRESAKAHRERTKQYIRSLERENQMLREHLDQVLEFGEM